MESLSRQLQALYPGFNPDGPQKPQQNAPEGTGESESAGTQGTHSRASPQPDSADEERGVRSTNFTNSTNPTVREPGQDPSADELPRGSRLDSRQAWRAALDEVTSRWDNVAAESRARGQEPPWLEEAEDERLQAEVAEAIRAGDHPRALAAIDCWRRAWLDFLADLQSTDPTSEPGWVEIDSDILGEHVVVALRPEAAREARLAHPGLVVYGADQVEHLHGIQDPNLIRVVHAAKKLLGGRVQDPKLADAVIEEFERRRPPPNPTVLAMFAETRARLGSRDLEERSLTMWLRQHAPEIAALWPEASLTASWYDWRQHVGREHLPKLDEAWKACSEGRP